ncbi:hypothetical protein B0T18DRAFT_79024 [Schizothecium vesticola]|uniref:Uncharacterized protein n=1 Tax=Schizothecium vesticola TaxID=314040 RepID=A0AA40KAG5_9PEZI|nr:hypothetical protein B0T18DRAFT_79024 [Schizothecium vesticola]
MFGPLSRLNQPIVPRALPGAQRTGILGPESDRDHGVHGYTICAANPQRISTNDKHPGPGQRGFRSCSLRWRNPTSPPAIAVDGDRIPGGVSIAEGAIKDGGSRGPDRSVLPLAAGRLPIAYHGRWAPLLTKTLLCTPSRRDGHASFARRFGHTDAHFSWSSSQMPIERYRVPSRNGVEEVRPGAGSGNMARRDTTLTAKVPVAKRQSPRH